ncbi:hypothetical protein H0N95_02065, partial [Candidatus Micrarchaeota archaeon]|nr:hypothetical protein [Candidatus Micrarchaeota archaeon]
MKAAIMLVLLISLASALSSYPEYVEAYYSVSGFISTGYSYIHVPNADVMQEAAQITHNEIFFDEAGAFINATGRYNYTTLLKINASKIQVTSDPSVIAGGTGEFLSSTQFIDSNDSNVRQKAFELTDRDGGETVLSSVQDITAWVHE